MEREKQRKEHERSDWIFERYVYEINLAKLVDKNVLEPNKEKILDMKRPEVTGTLKERETIETMMTPNTVTKVTAKTKTKVKSM